MKTTRLALLTSVALPLMIGGQAAFALDQVIPSEPIIVAQADSVAAAQAEVAAAQAALQEAQASGRDTAAAQARLDAALSALAAAEAAASAPQTEPEAAPPEPQPESPAEPPPPPEEPPAPPEAPVEPPPPPEAPPVLEAPPPPPEAPPTLETPAEPPAPPEAPPAPETPEPPAQLEAPPAVLPAPEAPQVDEPGPQPPATEEPPPAEGPAAPPAEEPPPPEGIPPVETPPAPDQGEAQPPVLPPPGEPGATPPTAETATPPAAEAEESAVETQLEAQGDQEAVENLRTLREKLHQGQASGGEAGEVEGEADRDRDGGEESRRGDDRDRDGDRDRRHRERPPEGDIVFDFGGRFIIQLGDQIVIRQDDEYESDRFLHRARDVDIEHFPGGYTRTTVTRGDGSQIITVRDRYGAIITRTRIDDRGRQVILIDNRDFYREGRRPQYVRFEDELPPLRIGIPREEYIVETSRADREAIRATLLAPPVEEVERRYAIEEIRTSERLRDKVRRIDLNTITFDFGSAAISPSQFDALAAVGQAIEDIVANSPDELFLVEGHTDAVGSDTDNLVLSDRRAEAIAVALSSNFNIPPENLIPQGYGEQYLKIPTAEEERENRRVAIRRITELAQGR